MSNVHVVRQKTMQEGAQNPVLVWTYLELLAVITAHVKLTRRRMNMTENDLMDIFRQAPLYVLVVNSEKVKINIIKGIVITVEERLAEPVPRSLEAYEEDTMDMMEPDPPYLPPIYVQSATDDRSMKDCRQEVSI